MLTCKLDGEEFEDRDKAMDHLRDAHSDLIDEELQEFIGDAEEIIFENQIDEEDE